MNSQVENVKKEGVFSFERNENCRKTLQCLEMNIESARDNEILEKQYG